MKKLLIDLQFSPLFTLLPSVLMGRCRFSLLIVMYLLSLDSTLSLSPGLAAENFRSTSQLTIPLTSETPVQFAQNASPAPPPSETPTANPASPKPGRVQTLIQGLKRRRGLIILIFGSIFVTLVSVFILLKLFNEDDLEPETPPETATTSELPANFFPPKAPDTPTENQKPTPEIPFVHENLTPKDKHTQIDPTPHSPANPPQALIPGTPPELLLPSDTTTTSFSQRRVEELIYNLQNPNPHHRHQAIWQLGERGDSRAILPLTSLLIHSDSKEHSLILAALSEIGSHTLKPLNRALAVSLQNENAEVRKNAIRDLTRIYELISQASHLLERAIDDPDPEVRETAQWALKQLNRVRPSDYR